MPTSISLPGFEGRDITVKSSMWSGQPQLMVDGVQVRPTTKTGVTFASDSAPLSSPTDAKKLPKGNRNEFLLRQNDGREVIVRIKPTFPDPAPVIEINGQTIRSARPLSIFEWIWAAFPLVLIILGGAIGGAIGAAGAVTNVNLIRDDSKGVLRYLLCAGVTVLTIVVWLILVTGLNLLVRR